MLCSIPTCLLGMFKTFLLHVSGYLKVLVDSLVEDDRTLQSLLTPQPPLLKALYTYESKMVRLRVHLRLDQQVISC